MNPFHFSIKHGKRHARLHDRTRGGQPGPAWGASRGPAAVVDGPQGTLPPALAPSLFLCFSQSLTSFLSHRTRSRALLKGFLFRLVSPGEEVEVTRMAVSFFL